MAVVPDSGILESNSAVYVEVGGINLGVFSAKTGGQVEADDTKFRPGGMAPQISFGGPVTTENVTVRKAYDTAMRGLFHTLASFCGKADMKVTYQPLDADGGVSSGKIVYSGKLTRVTPPDADANSNDVGLLELEMSSHGSVAQ